jgi:hypothetical protein
LRTGLNELLHALPFVRFRDEEIALRIHGQVVRAVAEPSQLGQSDPGMRFIFNKGTTEVSTTF